MSTVLVTGVAGFIGSNLAIELVNRGYTVKGIDNLATGQKANLETLTNHPQFTLYEKDIRNFDFISEIMSDVIHVFHQAAVPSVPRSVDDPVRTTDANCTGTATVLNAARKTDIDTVVVASSSSVYGSKTGLPKVESMQTNPESPYALSKMYTEKLALQFSNLYDINTIALRYFNIFGPRQDSTGAYAAVIPKFIQLMLNDNRPVIYDDGEQSRDFTYIENAVQANISAAKSNITGEIFNIGCENPITINSLVKYLNEMLGTSINPRYDDARPGDVRHSHADISKANELLGYKPTVEFKRGLSETIEYYR